MSVHAFGKVVCEIAGIDEDDILTTEQILTSESISSMTINENDVVIGLSRARM